MVLKTLYSKLILGHYIAACLIASPKSVLYVRHIDVFSVCVSAADVQDQVADTGQDFLFAGSLGDFRESGGE